MKGIRRSTPLAFLIAMVVCALPATAFADADPPSDVLLLQDVYLPYKPRVAPVLDSQLRATVARAKSAGYPLKVAIVASKADLGAVPQFLHKPKEYGPFLGKEIAFNQPKPVFTVMAAGYGQFDAGAQAQATIDALPKPQGSSSDQLVKAAIQGVAKLAAAAGKPIEIPKPGESGSAGGGSSGLLPILLICVPVVILVLIGAWLGLSRRSSKASDPAADDDEEGDNAPA